MGSNYFYRFGRFAIVSGFVLSELPVIAESELSNFTNRIHCALQNAENLPNRRWDHIWWLENSPSLWYKRRQDSHLLRFSKHIEFEVSLDLTHVQIYCSTNVSFEYVCHALVDQLLPRVVAHFGNLVLHGSGVLSENGAILFLGDSGWGKSTIAHNLGEGGMSLISDDCLILSADGCNHDSAYCIPTYPSLRLRKDTITRNYPGGVPIDSTVISEAGKLRIPVSGFSKGDFSKEIRIQHILFLSEPSSVGEISISDIPSRVAVVELVNNCFRLDVNDVKQTESLFSIAANIVEKTNVLRISYPHDYSRLSEVADRIKLL